MRERRSSNVEFDDNTNTSTIAPITEEDISAAAAEVVAEETQMGGGDNNSTSRGRMERERERQYSTALRTGSGEKSSGLSSPSRTTSSTSTTNATATAIGKDAREERQWNQNEDDDLLLANEKVPRGTIRATYRRPRLRSVWHCGFPLALITLFSIVTMSAIFHSYSERHGDVKGCRMSYMWPSYARLEDFDTEHTRFASKYSVYLYREENVDDTSKAALVKPKGVPVLFIPGNAGSYKQVRPLAAEAARYYASQAKANPAIAQTGSRPLDFFTVDFNEDITAFHGQTMLDQAEYLNEAVAYILSLYHDARKTTKDDDLPDPASVILVGHSMGGIVARTMLIMPNYQSNSINTIITMSAPHARPPVSFDADIVRTYERINSYWRKSYSAEWASHNPLWHVTLVSIAGGGLDTVVPSDYASVSSLVPETHGFTVFTSGVPNVWTGMDHQAILWCDQFRKVVAKALLEVVNVNRPGQTKPRAERMRVLKKHFLTGMEPLAEQSIKDEALSTLLTLEPMSQSIIPLGETLVLRNLGRSRKQRAYLLPVPPRSNIRGNSKFTFLSNRKLDNTNHDAKIEVLVCSTFPLQAGQAQNLFSMNMDLSGDHIGGTRLACKNAAKDIIPVPASTSLSRYPFEEEDPFSYIQYDLEDIGEHEFVAVVDKSIKPTHGFILAQFSDAAQADIDVRTNFPSLLFNGIHLSLPAQRPMVTEIHMPVIQSSLLSYKLSVGVQTCSDEGQLFTPLVRQYISDPYESKFFVNVHEADISLHGQAPFMPEPLKSIKSSGLSLQIWSDSTCNSPVEIKLVVDYAASLGKLVMRYRTIFAAFPLVIVALVLRKQFLEYDNVGAFITFNDGLGLMITETLPGLLAAISCLGIFLAAAQSKEQSGLMSLLAKYAEQTPILSRLKNDSLMGQADPFFWFLGPFFIVISTGVCAIINYLALILINICTGLWIWVARRPHWLRNNKKPQSPSPAAATHSSRRRFLVCVALLFLVATVIPYQFAYMVACIVQLVICIRALKYARESGYGSRTNPHWDFANYAHSLFILMLWVVPINLPVLVVWIHNLAVHWLTPFTSHHNVLSVMPFILLVETLTSGSMIPQCNNVVKHVTSLMLFGVAGYAVVYGVMYAYYLHHVVNFVAGWLVVLHFSVTGFRWKSLTEMFDFPSEEGKKQP